MSSSLERGRTALTLRLHRDLRIKVGYTVSDILLYLLGMILGIDSSPAAQNSYRLHVSGFTFVE